MLGSEAKSLSHHKIIHSTECEVQLLLHQHANEYLWRNFYASHDKNAISAHGRRLQKYQTVNSVTCPTWYLIISCVLSRVDIPLSLESLFHLIKKNRRSCDIFSKYLMFIILLETKMSFKLSDDIRFGKITLCKKYPLRK